MLLILVVNNLADFLSFSECMLSASFMSQIDIQANDVMEIAFHEALSQTVGQQWDLSPYQKLRSSLRCTK